jgi:hypothetical protein
MFCHRDDAEVTEKNLLKKIRRSRRLGGELYISNSSFIPSNASRTPGGNAASVAACAKS